LLTAFLPRPNGCLPLAADGRCQIASAGAQTVHLYYLKGVLQQRIVFIKKKLMPPRGALRGGGKHLNWGMGASAPIITSKDFNGADFFKSYRS